MPNPNKFIATSDFATFPSDSLKNTISVTINSGTLIATTNPSWTKTETGGSPKSFLRARMLCSLDNKWGSGTGLFTLLNVSLMDGGTPLVTEDVALYCNLDKISDTSVQLKLWIGGLVSPYQYRINETVTVTFVYSTFINPLL
jgi:hypothetical protein